MRHSPIEVTPDTPGPGESGVLQKTTSMSKWKGGSLGSGREPLTVTKSVPSDTPEMGGVEFILTNMGYGEFVAIFRENGVATLDTMVAMDTDMWAKLGVKKVHQAQIVLKAKTLLAQEKKM